MYLILHLYFWKGFDLKEAKLNNRPNFVSYNPADFHCGVDDTTPVDTHKLWKEEQNCFDHIGSLFDKNKIDRKSPS